MLPLRQASAEITEPSEDNSSDNTTTFVASLALLLNVRALLHNVAQLSGVAVKVTFPDQRQLFYQPKPSEIRNISATTDSLQAAVVISHAAWTGMVTMAIITVSIDNVIVFHSTGKLLKMFGAVNQENLGKF